MVENLLNEADTLITGEKKMPDGIDPMGVPRAFTCADHAEMMKNVGEMHAMLTAGDNRMNRIEVKLDDALRGQSKQTTEIALLEERAKQQAGKTARNEARLWSVGINALSIAGQWFYSLVK